jgi:hypothetical protein
MIKEENKIMPQKISCELPRIIVNSFNDQKNFEMIKHILSEDESVVDEFLCHSSAACELRLEKEYSMIESYIKDMTIGQNEKDAKQIIGMALMSGLVQFLKQKTVKSERMFKIYPDIDVYSWPNLFIIVLTMIYY